MTIKGENQIYADIIGFINTSLSALNITGWQVLQLKQPVKLTELSPTLYVTCTLKRRLGWQYRDYRIIEAGLKNTQYFKQEVDVQISALRTRELEDTVNTLNSSDILELLKTHMLKPDTLQDLRALGYRIYQPSEIQSPDYINDSDNFEFMPFFTVTFILNQSLSSPQTSIDEYTLKMKGI